MTLSASVKWIELRERKLQALLLMSTAPWPTRRDRHSVRFDRAFAAAGLGWDWSVDVYGELLKVSGGKEPSAGISTSTGRMSRRAATPTPTSPVCIGQEPILRGTGGGRRCTAAAGRQAPAARGARGGSATRHRDDHVDGERHHAPGALHQPRGVTLVRGDRRRRHRAREEAGAGYLSFRAGGSASASRSVPGAGGFGQRAARGADRGAADVGDLSDYARHDDFHGAAVVLDHLGEPELPVRVWPAIWAARPTWTWPRCAPCTLVRVRRRRFRKRLQRRTSPSSSPSSALGSLAGQVHRATN